MMLLAPNGKPSNLTPKQYKLVRTKAFKDWFGDWENDLENSSKVVDENGEPLVCYHGSNREFSIFDKNLIGSANDSGFYGKGFYFIYDSISVKQYGNIIKPYFLKIKNPVITYDSPKEFSTSIWIPKGAKNLIGQGLKPYEWQEWNFYLDDNFSEKVTNYIREKGRDGIIAENVGEYVVYEPEQIKLADGSNTTFDGNNPDIRYNDGGLIENELSIIIKGVTNENKYKGNYKKIFDLIEENITFYNPYGTSFEELKNNDFYINITPKPESIIIEKISKLKGVEIINPDIRFEEGGDVNYAANDYLKKKYNHIKKENATFEDLPEIYVRVRKPMMRGGKYLPSTNHQTNQKEDGISVFTARYSPNSNFVFVDLDDAIGNQEYDYNIKSTYEGYENKNLDMYLVEGEVVKGFPRFIELYSGEVKDITQPYRRGADGERLLNTKNFKIIGKLNPNKIVADSDFYENYKYQDNPNTFSGKDLKKYPKYEQGGNTQTFTYEIGGL